MGNQFAVSNDYPNLRVVTTMRIGSREPVRTAFAGCSTNGKSVGYYETKGHATKAFNNALLRYGFCFDFDCCFDLPGDTGSGTFSIISADTVIGNKNACLGIAYLSWYRMPSGRYEMTGYIASWRTADGGQRTADGGRRTADSGRRTADGRK